MKDLRFIYEPDNAPEECKVLVEEFLEQGQKFNERYAEERENEEAYRVLKENGTNPWREFKEIFLRLTQRRCPICEARVNKYDDIEHFRPKSWYWWLAFDFRNYYPCCDLCNRAYKRTGFPLLVPEKQVHFENRHEINGEQPLLFNPTTDDPCELFELHFRKLTYKVRILPKRSLDTQSYEYKKAEETIRFYDLNAEHSTDKEQRRANNLDLYGLLADYDTFLEQLPTQPSFEQYLQLQQKRKFIEKLGIGLVKLIEKSHANSVIRRKS